MFYQILPTIFDHILAILKGAEKNISNLRMIIFYLSIVNLRCMWKNNGQITTLCIIFAACNFISSKDNLCKNLARKISQ